MLAFAAPYLEHDPHSMTRASQRNTTLYLDTRGFRFCDSHLLLSPDRSKREAYSKYTTAALQLRGRS